MDPNANLLEQRQIIAELAAADCQRACAHQEKLERLVELSVALDNWISDGGFLPEAWQR